MREQILLVPGANGTELTRMLARFGKNTLGLRVMGTAEFARFALMRSGVVLKEGFLPRKQEPAVIDGFIRQIPYFTSAGYADSEKLADALFRLRSLITGQESETIHSVLPGGEFLEKNESLVEVYDRYMSALAAAGNIDTVALVRKTLELAKPLGCPVYTLQEYPLSPLEQQLADRLAGTRIDSSLPQLLDCTETAVRNIDYTESYGSSNEVEAIFDYIVSNRIAFDECTVAVANTAQYAQLFYDFAQSRELPVRFGCGVPILNSNPAKLLKLLYDWSTTGYYGVDALRALLYSDAMDQKKLMSELGVTDKWHLNQVTQIAGQLRLSFDQAQNSAKLAAMPGKGIFARYRDALTAFSNILALGESELLRKFAMIREDPVGRVDRSALSVICDALDAYAKYTDGRSLDQIIPEILQKAVCSENSREGALFVTGISGALASVRKHLFIAGMGASNFPGAPRENYLLLDSDYLLFADENTAPTSMNTVQRKKNTLNHLLSLASALNVQTHISYSGYDLAELKEENPSSVLFDVFRKQYGEKATLDQYKAAFRHVVYFGQQVSDDHTVGNAYVQGKQINYTALKHEEAPCAHVTDRAFSPTAIDKFFKCPRYFMLVELLGIQEPEEDDPFTVISAAETGTLAHSLMEELAHTPYDLETFLKRADEQFDRFLLTRPPIHPEVAAAEKQVFCKMMENAYEMDPKNEVLASEEDQVFPHDSGILLKGIPDRVEKTADGEYIIADYKTGRNIKHNPHDIDTCLQVVIYAYLLQKRGVPISSCVYRYLRNKKDIPCRYDKTMEQKLNEKLLELKNALDTGVFPLAQSKEACKYCKLSDICGKKEPVKEEAE